MFMSIILRTKLWAIEHLLLSVLLSSPFFFLPLITSLIFSLPTKTFYKKNKSPDLSSIFLQNNSPLRKVKIDRSISFIQV